MKFKTILINDTNERPKCHMKMLTQHFYFVIRMIR